MPSNRIEMPQGDWGDGTAKNITFIVTEDCQLRCKYCYINGKNSKNKMSFNTAQKAIDYLLDDRILFNEQGAIWEFIGGEPFLEVELINEISDYIKKQMYLKNHPWFNCYRFNFSTNGLLYNNTLVQEYIEKNKSHMSISITLDGTKEKHDKQRIFVNGKGSYNSIVKNIPLWLSQFPYASTKSTISHDDIPFIKDSVLHLWSIGITQVNMNTVFEDVWQENDDILFEEQLVGLADEILKNELYKNNFCSLFQRNIGLPMDPYLQNQNWCGAGKMLAIDYKGTFFPCIRFVDFSLSNKQAREIGSVDTGIDQNKLRPFFSVTRCVQSNEECIKCEYASGCAWCQGGNYDFASTDTIFQRATYICKMHKARVRANNYFWNRYDKEICK